MSVETSGKTPWKYVGFLLGITVAAEAIALYCLQKAHKTQNKSWLYTSMVIYGLIVATLLHKMLHYQGIGMVNFLWNIFSTISGFMIGVLLFSEKVNGVQCMGVALGFVGFAMIVLGDKKKAATS